MARTGGLIAAALLGAVLAAKGVALTGLFHAAAVVGAAAALGASISAFTLIAEPGRKPGQAGRGTPG